jgi:hypothetical protein
MAKKEVTKIVGQIELEEMKLKEIEDRIDNYSAKAQECRKVAMQLQSTKEPSLEIHSRINELLEQANYYYSLAEQLTHTERYNQLQKLNLMKETAVRLRHTINHNKGVLSESIKNLDEVKQTALEMVENAEQKIINLKLLISQQEKELIVLEGGLPDE